MKKLLLVLLLFLFTNSFSQTTNQKLNTFIKEWLGTPYKYGGSTKKGIDCSKFSRTLYKEVFEIELGLNCQSQWSQSIRINKDELTLGDLIFFNSKKSPSGWHCAVYLGDDKMIHSAGRVGVIISDLNEPKYLKIYKGAGKILR